MELSDMARFYCLDEKEYNYLLNMIDRAMDPDTRWETVNDVLREVRGILASLPGRQEQER
ncbi:MAG: hypothetical protein ACP5QH_06070 [Thermoplasmata archaeon]